MQPIFFFLVQLTFKNCFGSAGKEFFLNIPSLASLQISIFCSEIGIGPPRKSLPDGEGDLAVVSDAADEPEAVVLVAAVDAVPVLVGLPVRSQRLGAAHVAVEIPGSREKMGNYYTGVYVFMMSKVLCLFSNLHSRGERGRKRGRECKF